MDNANNQTFEHSRSSMISELESRIERYARVSHYVLIMGERGTGKTTIAKRLHQKSSRSKREFVNVNCASLSQELLESELFGYEKGAFTGANAPKAGLFEIASGGTLFLDEIGEMTLSLQAKLLKAVEEKCIRRVGSTAERPVDVRIIAATSRDLRAMVEGGQFRPDLFDRLNILNLETVPLRYQKEKIKNLVCRQLNIECSSIGREEPFEICEDAILELEGQDWYGNFRELLNFTTRLAVECIDDAVITRDMVRRILGERSGQPDVDKNFGTPSIPASKMLDNVTPTPDNIVTVTFDSKSDDLDSIYVKAAGTVIKHALQQNNGNLRRAARSMGATHSTLSRILKKYNERNERVSVQDSSLSLDSYAIAA